MRTERYVFFPETSTSQSRNVVRHHTHTLTLTNTLTLSHTHMTGQPWLAGQVVPEEFFSGFANIFGPKWSARIFGTARGSRKIQKYYPQRVNCFFHLC